MSSQVVQMVSESAVDEAWEQYAVLARQLRDNPDLLSDRAFNERLARAHEKWRRLFLIRDRVR